MKAFSMSDLEIRSHLYSQEQMPTFNPAEMERKVRSAIKELLRKDSFLLRNNVNERSISHRLAAYLQSQFKGWHVDCEYNRDHDVRKELHVPHETRELDDTEAKTVFPDIIIHKRNTSNNLLVVEIKKSTSSESADYDKSKLGAFVKPPFNYRHGLFIKFTAGQKQVSSYELDWFPKDIRST